MGWRDEISEVVQLHNLNPSLSYWCNILNWTADNYKSLSVTDLEYLAYESERCRERWNRDHEYTVFIQKNGKLQEQVLVKPGLGIEKDDVFPNIHRMIEQKLEEQRIEEDEELPEENNSPRTEVTQLPDVIPLAASSK